MRLAALISGGKDSMLALHHAVWEGHEVAYLVAMFPQRADSWMFHVPNVHLTPLVAEALGIPLVKGLTSGLKERELEDLKAVLAKLDVDGIVSGPVRSRYQKERIDRICRDLGLVSYAPLWGRDELAILRELVEGGFEAIFVGVFAYGLDSSWLGRRLDEEAIRDLLALRDRYDISLIGEGGEYETLVLDAPLYRSKLEITDYEVLWDGYTGVLKVLSARLVPKRG
ncbi:TIGR00289 family protein [Candidatus Bathyarchaeota archaeon ex4484_135]|nr:MAG: TIGR00289 family protein [Candidatus Bathyarchaeota archaeon ex4484_135]